MANEDLTTFTEVDIPADRMTIAANKATITGADRDEQFYCYKDKGAGSISDGFEHFFDTKITSTANNGLIHNWGVSNDINDQHDWSHGLSAKYNPWLSGTLKLRIILVDRVNGADFYDKDPHDETKTWYMTAERNGAAGTLKLYNDSDRTDLVDTLSVTAEELNYRYIYCAISNNDGTSGKSCGGYLENLDLQTAPAPPSGPDFVPDYFDSSFVS